MNSYANEKKSLTVNFELLMATSRCYSSQNVAEIQEKKKSKFLLFILFIFFLNSTSQFQDITKFKLPIDFVIRVVLNPTHFGCSSISLWGLLECISKYKHTFDASICVFSSWKVSWLELRRLRIRIWMFYVAVTQCVAFTTRV